MPKTFQYKYIEANIKRTPLNLSSDSVRFDSDFRFFTAEVKKPATINITP